jgi:hypothetical protein
MSPPQPNPGLLPGLFCFPWPEEERPCFTAMCEASSYTNERPLDSSISAFGGPDDQGVVENVLADWKYQTEASFRLKQFPGDHSNWNQNEKHFYIASIRICRTINVHPKQGCIRTDQRIESVDLFLASFAGWKGIAGT